MLTGITLENFKAFKEPQFIPFKPITLVFGPNNSGKSSIIHALAFLHHVRVTKGHCDPDTVNFGWGKVYLGSWRNLVHGHDTRATMNISLHTKARSIKWSFEDGPEGPRVASFIISENGFAVSRGTNEANKGIQWAIELHARHPMWPSWRDAIWRAMTKEDEASVENQGRNRKDKERPSRIRKDTDQQKHGNDFQETFNNLFKKWLGDSWRRVNGKPPSFSSATSSAHLCNLNPEVLGSFPFNRNMPDLADIWDWHDLGNDQPDHDEIPF